MTRDEATNLMRRAVRRAGEALGRIIAEQRRLERLAAEAEQAERRRRALRKTRPGR